MTRAFNHLLALRVRDARKRRCHDPSVKTLSFLPSL